MGEGKERYRGVIEWELEHFVHSAGAETKDCIVSASPVTVRLQTLEQVVLFGWYARGQVYGDLLVSDMTVEQVGASEYHLTFHGVYMVDPFAEIIEEITEIS